MKPLNLNVLVGCGTSCDADGVKGEHGARCLSRVADKGEGEGRFKELVLMTETAHEDVALDLSLVLIANAAAAAAAAAATVVGGVGVICLRVLVFVVTQVF